MGRCRVCVRASYLLAALTAIAAPAAAQHRLVTMDGAVLSVHGDTVAYERDTMALIEIDGRDTITMVHKVNGRTLARQVYTLRGDSAQLVGVPTGERPSTVVSPRMTSKQTAMRIRGMLDRERQQREFRETMSRKYPDKPMRVPDPSTRPEYPQTYILWSRVRLLQHLDTIKRVHDCPVREWPDTAVFVLYGADSVKRIRPEPRRFGFVMRQTLIG